jgi:hypothetical protein
MELNNKELFDLEDAVFYSNYKVSKALLRDLKLTSDEPLVIDDKDRVLINRYLKKKNFLKIKNKEVRI